MIKISLILICKKCGAPVDIAEKESVVCSCGALVSLLSCFKYN